VVPLYLIVRQFGWIDTYQALILPFAMSAFGIFLMRQFIVSIPDDYIAAARVDGASEIRIFLEIIVPLSRPAMTTLAILVFVQNWDEFLWPLVVVSSDDLRTLPIGLAKFLGQYQNQWNLLMAGAVVAALPVVLLFLFLQRRFLESLSGLSGIK
jgi:multiple sugar transport system permease protein